MMSMTCLPTEDFLMFADPMFTFLDLHSRKMASLSHPFHRPPPKRQSTGKDARNAGNKRRDFDLNPYLLVIRRMRMNRISFTKTTPVLRNDIPIDVYQILVFF